MFSSSPRPTRAVACLPATIVPGSAPLMITARSGLRAVERALQIDELRPVLHLLFDEMRDDFVSVPSLNSCPASERLFQREEFSMMRCE